MTEQEAMELALDQARVASQRGEVPVGAVILRAGEVVAFAGNEREALQSPLAHAECIAIERAAKALQSWRLLDCLLVVTLEPCPMCLAAAQQARVSKVIFGTEDPKGGALSLGFRIHEDPRTNHRFEVLCQETPESQVLLRNFFRERRGKKHS